MSSALREWLASCISPELARRASVDAAKVRFMTHRAEELRDWCYGYSSIASHCGRWMLERTRVHFMSSEQFNTDAEAGKFHFSEDIHDLRKRLQAAEAAPRKAVGWGS